MTNKTFALWLTGLSGAGKTTLARAIKDKLNDQHKIHHLDGDEVRAASEEKLGFTREGRDKNIDLAIDLVKGYQAKGYMVIASFISPYREHREWGRQRLINYIEVHVHAPLEVCETRDPKGLYKKARAGEIKLFTGIDDPYEEPEEPHVYLETHLRDINECVDMVIKHLENRGFIEGV